MKRPVGIWTRYDDGSIDYCMVEQRTSVAGSIPAWLSTVAGRLSSYAKRGVDLGNAQVRAGKTNDAADALMEKHNA